MNSNRVPENGFFMFHELAIDVVLYFHGRVTGCCKNWCLKKNWGITSSQGTLLRCHQPHKKRNMRKSTPHGFTPNSWNSISNSLSVQTVSRNSTWIFREKFQASKLSVEKSRGFVMSVGRFQRSGVSNNQNLAPKNEVLLKLHKFDQNHDPCKSFQLFRHDIVEMSASWPKEHHGCEQKKSTSKPGHQFYSISTTAPGLDIFGGGRNPSKINVVWFFIDLLATYVYIWYHWVWWVIFGNHLFGSPGLSVTTLCGSPGFNDMIFMFMYWKCSIFLKLVQKPVLC